MNNKKKMVNKKTANTVSLVLVIVAVILWFVLTPLRHPEAAAELLLGGPVTYLGAAFGKKHGSTNVDTLNFSILNFIPLLLMAFAALTLLFNKLKPKALKEQNVKLIVVVLSVLAVVLLFLVKTFLVEVIFEGFYDKMKLTFEAFIIPVLLLGTAALQILKK